MRRGRRRQQEPEPLMQRHYQHSDGPLTCALCGRMVSRVSKHHLIPKSEGGTETVPLCAPCHKTLHSFFTNHTLATDKRSLDQLRDDPQVQRYLAWIRRQPDRKITVRTNNNRY